MTIDVDEFRRELLRLPEAWKPNPGETLIGAVVSVTQRSGYQDRPYPVVNVLVADLEGERELSFHAYHSVAKDEIEALSPQAGDTIGIGYHGRVRKEGDEGEGYEMYRIKVLKPDIAGDVHADELQPEPVATPAGDDTDDIPF